MLYLPLTSNDIANMARIITLNFYIPPHWHDEIEIIYVLEGGFTAKIGDGTYKIRQGQSIWVNSMEIHEYSVLPNEMNTKVLHLTISPLLVGDGFQQLVKNTFRAPVLDINGAEGLDISAVKRVYYSFSVIVDEIQHASSAASLEADWSIRGCMLRLTALIRRSLQTDSGTSKKQLEARYAATNIYPAIEYVQQNYDKDIRVDTVAALTGYKASNFCKHFKNATSMSFHRYLKAYRISRACALLGEYSTSISRVAERVGFPEVKTFCRVFKSCIGLTPSEYRSTIFVQKS